MSSSLFCFLLIIIGINYNDAGCPFANMMNNYNFSGSWSYNDSVTDIAMVMHMCHHLNGEIYFTLAKNNTPRDLIGFGSGNWSQSSMMIGGMLSRIDNDTTASHGFGIGMNMELHQWWLQDPYRSVAINQDNQNQYTSTDCLIPYGLSIKHEYYADFWDKKRTFHRLQRIEKRKKDREKKRRFREEKKKYQIIKYWETFLKVIGWNEDPDINIDDENGLQNAKFTYDVDVNFPNLFKQTWITIANDDNALYLTLNDNKNGCFNGNKLSNISISYYGTGINSFIETNDGIKNGQFFVQIEQDKIIGSSVTMKRDDNGDIIEDEIRMFEMHKSDTFIPCSSDKTNCNPESDDKCEL